MKKLLEAQAKRIAKKYGLSVKCDVEITQKIYFAEYEILSYLKWKSKFKGYHNRPFRVTYRRYVENKQFEILENIENKLNMFYNT